MLPPVPDEKLAVCRDLGAELIINRKTQEIKEEIQKASDGVDVVLCPVGADYLGTNLSVLKPFGRLVLIGLLSRCA